MLPIIVNSSGTLEGGTITLTETIDIFFDAIGEANLERLLVVAFTLAIIALVVGITVKQVKEFSKATWYKLAGFYRQS